MPPDYRYPWPASAITPEEMRLLHAVREASSPRIPITILVARAIRKTYGQKLVLDLPEDSLSVQDRKVS